jgi:3-deoxy-7-phosphoheptulonate synthase
MLLRLRPSTSEPDLEVLRALAREKGYALTLLGRDGLVAELVRAGSRASPGDLNDAGKLGDPGDRVVFEDLAFVAAVLDASDAPELAERAGREDTILRVGDAAFGGPYVALIAGPCAVEDEDVLLEIARAVKAGGATLLRGGAYKPRTSPYAFQGRGKPALEALARARAETGLGIVTEVLDPRDVAEVAAVADVLQIGARSMSNFALLAEVACTGRTILLKRGLAATAR